MLCRVFTLLSVFVCLFNTQGYTLPALVPVFANNFPLTPSYYLAQDDTSALPEDATDSLIRDLIRSKEKPNTEKITYLSQQTKYGFKNLFTGFGYNAALPYSMQVNPKAELYMQDYLNQHKKSLLGMKEWAMPYFNLIDHILTQYGVPRELKYLAVIESNLKTSATSWVGAAGPWQFMPGTARDYGLMVNSQADERRDYFKSTHAASRYLLELYRNFHDWLLVIAAYNGGPGRVYDAIKKSGSRNFWDLQYYLPQESRNHVKKFIATHYIMETGPGGTEHDAGSISKNNGDPLLLANAPRLSAEELAGTEKQTISGKYLGKIIAEYLAIDQKTFDKYNPDFDKRLSANGQFDLLLPAEKMEQFRAIKYDILNASVQQMLGAETIPATRTVYPKSQKKNNRSR